MHQRFFRPGMESGECPHLLTGEALAVAFEPPSLIVWAMRSASVMSRSARLRQANQKAHDAYEILKEAAAAYIEAQRKAAVAAREAHDGGITLTELDTSWLGVAAEQGVVEARIELSQKDAQAQRIDDEVGKVLDALRAAGYEPALRIEGIEIHGGGSVPGRTPAMPDDTPDTQTKGSSSHQSLVR